MALHAAQSCSDAHRADLERACLHLRASQPHRSHHFVTAVAVVQCRVAGWVDGVVVTGKPHLFHFARQHKILVALDVHAIDSGQIERVVVTAHAELAKLLVEYGEVASFPEYCARCPDSLRHARR